MPTSYHPQLQLEGRGVPVLLYYRANERETAQALRQSFAFLRQNADRRYSASVLMSLLSFADQIDQLHDGPNPPQEGELPPPVPSVITLSTPFYYDEETEVKSGGLLGVAVTLPDRRVLLAAQRDIRRQRIGTTITGMLIRLTASDQNYWVHRENTVGQQFLLSQGFMPFDLNRQGAVLYRMTPPPAPDTGAVEYMEDDEIERQLRRTPRRSPSFTATARPRPEMRIPGWTVDDCVSNPAPEVEADPQLERLLREEEEIEARTREDGVPDHRVQTVYELDGSYWAVSTLTATDRGWFYQNPRGYELEGGPHQGYNLAGCQQRWPDYLSGLMNISASQPTFFVRIVRAFLNREETF